MKVCVENFHFSVNINSDAVDGCELLWLWLLEEKVIILTKIRHPKEPTKLTEKMFVYFSWI